jgi:hypothetical protein
LQPRRLAQPLGSQYEAAVKFEIVGKIEEQQTFATGNAIREIIFMVKRGGESARV